MPEERYPQAVKVRLVLDNLNTHNIASLNETLAPAEARRLAERLEIHHTPKHGSWLNIAETEFSALSGQCLKRRIPTLERMQSEIAGGRLLAIRKAHRSTGFPRAPGTRRRRSSLGKACVEEA